VEAPNYRKGFITVTFLSAALIATAIIIRVLHARELAKGLKHQHLITDSDEEVVEGAVVADVDGKRPAS
jgi:ACS family pantothenate transporter-like MFS transporter